MKEAYFKTGNIHAVAAAMLEKCNRSRFVKSIDLKHCALLLIDLQSYFTDSQSRAFLPASVAVLPELLKLSTAWKEAGLPQILSRHIDPESPKKEMESWWKNKLTASDPLSQIISPYRESDIPLIEKQHYDAFLNTHLKKQLKSSGIKQLIIAGFKTNLCCESTARSAFMHGFEVFFPVDAGCTNNRAYHEASLLNLSYGFANLLLIDDILKILNR